ncbi:rhomboid family intramembrane serine protease [Flavobacterium sediminilitoris]|uniref:Rhomboid family intramembrane serine protease n=1 Tax=Flavobacterium sediminilitoris TaxID=2024526 RepID=A0ABY4HI66_9FLAO|nr:MULTISPECIES: rhomboid family intramembrane serine protease [Flavobacterium]UOX32273.1 rhomboid family intramembrane serine protease [Flavobacterium sediminilitoris]
MIRMTDMVKHLLIINIIFFIGSYILPNSIDLLALHYFESDKFQFWQPITHMFMHGGPMHIFFNMFALVSFGSALEQMWGSNKFLFFYFSCGIGAALLHTGANYYQFHNGLNVLLENGVDKEVIFEILNQGKYSTNWTEYLSQSSLDGMASSFIAPAVGASGAIYGLLVAFAFMFPNAELALMFIPVPIKAKYFVPGLLTIDLYLGLQGSSLFGSGGTGVAHFAHLGGALVGFIMMWYWKKNQFNKNRWDR